jgi:Transposase DDE domain group 1
MESSPETRRKIVGWIPLPTVWYKGFLYQAASWTKARRVVAKVEFHAGELFPRLGFIVTNLNMRSRAVVRFYNKFVKHARYYWLFLAEGHLNRRRFGAMLARIALLPISTG